ncbi:MAG: apolipoprotein N-acyltransferase [Candidatus Cloacimonetes bacterium]|nr:apolipoprotein N-acyltransferase [Candidatus Cloacimonadota bacterium]
MNLTAARLLPLVDTRRAPLRAALMSGLLLAAAFPPSPAFLLGLIALVPFYRVLLETRHGFRTGLVAGFGYNLGTVWWIGLNSDLPAAAALASMLAAVLWLSLLWGVSAALTVWFVRRHGALGLWAHPLAVIAVDWIVSGSEMGFPWNLIGVSQALNPMIRPVAALAGMHGMTLIVLAVNLLVLMALLGARSWRPLLAAVLLLGSAGVAGWYSTPRSPATGELELLLVQGNVDPLQKWRRPWSWCLGIHERLSREALAQAPADLVIWPETAVPTRISHNFSALQRLIRFSHETGTPLLTGVNDFSGDRESGKPQNGAYLVDSTGVLDRYYKIQLVPFGERVPGQKLLPILGSLNLGQAEFRPGERRSPGILPRSGDTLRFGESICFEGNFAPHARAMVLGGAELLTNQTNDAWFGHSWELDQHLAVARLRSVETGRWLVRACNNGYSAAIDERGRIREILPKGVRGVLRARVETRDGLTVYTRTGDLLPVIGLALLALAGALVLRRNRKEAP